MYIKKSNHKCLDCGSKIIQSRNGRLRNCFFCQKTRRAKYLAKERHISFNLTPEQFKNLWQAPCYYCGSEIKTIGIDRINNNEGYILNNVVSCCKICNFMKGKLSKKVFIINCKKIAKRF
jgi:hypothetical protein